MLYIIYGFYYSVIIITVLLLQMKLIISFSYLILGLYNDDIKNSTILIQVIILSQMG